MMLMSYVTKKNRRYKRLKKISKFLLKREGKCKKINKKCTLKIDMPHPTFSSLFISFPLYIYIVKKNAYR